MIGYIEDDFKVLKEFKYEDDNKNHVYQLRQTKHVDFEEYYSRVSRRFFGDIEKLKEEKPDKYNQCKKSYESEIKPYISIEICNKGDSHGLDLLLFYSDELKEKTIDSDWDLISTDKTVKIKDLSHDYRIENHHTGYGKYGCVVMY
jgi:hypothetical protein